MIRFTKFGAALAALVAAPGTAMAVDLGPTEAVDYAKATRYVMCGPNARVNLRAGERHTFNLKKADYVYSADGSTQWITGQISHHLFGRPDDQIYFTHTYKAADGAWKFDKADIKINRGGWGALLGPIGAGIKAYLTAKGKDAKDIKPEDIQKATMDAAALVGGNWEGAVNILVANIALAGQNWRFCQM